MKTDYNANAKKFLSDTETTISITEATTQKTSPWCKKGEKHGINYTVTLENKNHKYTFDFWGSIANKEIADLVLSTENMMYEGYSFKLKNELKKRDIDINPFNYRFRPKQLLEVIKKEIIPTEYDIFACLNVLSDDNFEDFCSTYGYDTDSIQAEKTYNACIEQDRNIRKLFNHNQIELLTEID